MFETVRLLPVTIVRIAREYSRKLWVRVVGMGLLALLAVGLTQIIELFVPEALASHLPGEAADRLLQIIANAMLAATIFTITVMVTVYRNSSSQWTPRVHRLIMQDRTTQRTLAAFIGAYVYALVAIVLRELGVFVDDRALVLFVMTVLVLVLIVLSLVRWVLHLQTFGSLLDTTRQLEELTLRQLRERLKTPCLGAKPLIGPVPPGSWPVLSRQSGYIQNVFPEGLNSAARRHDVEIYLSIPIGTFVFAGDPLMWVSGELNETEQERGAFEATVCGDVTMGDLRTYDQDPRFGFVVLGEVASKALSPGINDPGTAIDVISRIGRILTSYSDEAYLRTDARLERLWVPPLSPADLLDDGLGALARDGAHLYEVQHRIQATLAGLTHHPDPGLSEAARRMAERVLSRALAAMTFGPDRERLLRAAPREVRLAVATRISSPD